MSRVGSVSTIRTQTATIILLIGCLVIKDAAVNCHPTGGAEVTSAPATYQYSANVHPNGDEPAATESATHQPEPEQPKAATPGTYSFYSFSIDGDKAKTDVKVSGPGISYNYQVNNETPKKPVVHKPTETDVKLSYLQDAQDVNAYQQGYLAPVNGKSYDVPASSQSHNAPAPALSQPASDVVNVLAYEAQVSVPSYKDSASEQPYIKPDDSQSYAPAPILNSINQPEVKTPVANYSEPSEASKVNENQPKTVQPVNAQPKHNLYPAVPQNKGFQYSIQHFASKPTYYLFHNQPLSLAPAVPQLQVNTNSDINPVPLTGITVEPSNYNQPIYSNNQYSNVPTNGEYQNSPSLPPQSTFSQPNGPQHNAIDNFSNYQSAHRPNNSIHVGYQNPAANAVLTNVVPSANVFNQLLNVQQSYNSNTGGIQQNYNSNNYANEGFTPLNSPPYLPTRNSQPQNNLNQVYGPLYEEDHFGKPESGYPNNNGDHYDSNMQDGSEHDDNVDDSHHFSEPLGYPPPMSGVGHGIIMASSYDINSASSQNYEQNLPYQGGNFNANRTREGRESVSGQTPSPLVTEKQRQTPLNNTIPLGNPGTVVTPNYAAPMFWYLPITTFAGNHVFPTPTTGNVYTPLMRFQRHQPSVEQLTKSFATVSNNTSNGSNINHSPGIDNKVFSNLPPTGGTLRGSPINPIDLGAVTSYQDLLTKLTAHTSNLFQKNNYYLPAGDPSSTVHKTYYPSANYLQNMRTYQNFPRTYTLPMHQTIASSTYSTYLPTVLNYVHNRFHQLSAMNEFRNAPSSVRNNAMTLSYLNSSVIGSNQSFSKQPSYATNQPYYATTRAYNYRIKNNADLRKEHDLNNTSSRNLSFGMRKKKIVENQNDAKKHHGSNYHNSRLNMSNDNGIATIVYNSSSPKTNHNISNLRETNKQLFNSTFETIVQRLSQSAPRSKLNHSAFDEYLLTSQTFINNQYSPANQKIITSEPSHSWPNIENVDGSNNAAMLTKSEKITTAATDSELKNDNFYDYIQARRSIKSVYEPNFGRRMDQKISMENSDVIDDEVIRKKRSKRRIDDSELNKDPKTLIQEENGEDFSTAAVTAGSLDDKDVIPIKVVDSDDAIPTKVVHKFLPFKSSSDAIVLFPNQLQVSALADIGRSDDEETDYVRIQRSDRNVRGYTRGSWNVYDVGAEVTPYHMVPEQMEVHGKEKGYIIMRHYDPEYLQSKQRYHSHGDKEDYSIQSLLNFESFRMDPGPYRQRRNNYVVPRY